MTRTILIVEDEQAIADSIAYALRTDGFTPRHVMLGEQALAILRSASETDTAPQLVLLDIGLPDMSGLEACRRLRQFDYRITITDRHGLVLFDSTGRDVGRDYARWNDVYLTLQGKYGARSTRSDPDDEMSTVMHVDAPIRDGGEIIGVLTVAKPNASVQAFVERSQRIILQRGAILLLLSLLIGLAFAWWLHQALGKLMAYIGAVEAGRKVALPLLGNSEIGILGRALEAMRARLEGKEYVEQLMHTLTHELKSPIAAIHASAEPLAVAPLLAQVGQDATAALAARGVLLEVSAIDAQVAGDALLRQALGNLLDNAIGFAPQGSRIDLRAAGSGKGIAISVRDRGEGIPAYALERVFERFYSLPRPQAGKSTGLGLPFVREVALLHGGTVAVGNHDGGGALACLWLPLA